MENYPVFRRAMLHFKVCIYVLLSRSPVALAGPFDLHAGIHISSVHPELESNSQINLINFLTKQIVLTLFKLNHFARGLESTSQALFETTLKN